MHSIIEKRKGLNSLLQMKKRKLGCSLTLPWKIFVTDGKRRTNRSAVNRADQKI